MKQALLVAAGGALGAVGRYLISQFFLKRLPISIPLGTLTVNVLGCFLIGLFLSSTNNPLSNSTKLFLITGVLGALTTFSTFGLETVRCAHAEGLAMGIGNVMANVVLGLGCVLLGMQVAKWCHF